MKVLIVLNDPPYGTERVYNGLRLAINLLTKQEQVELQIFLMGDAAGAAKSGQITPNGYYNVERMLSSLHYHHYSSNQLIIRLSLLLHFHAYRCQVQDLGFDY